MSRTVTATLVALHRMTNSPNGNPRWRLVVSNESGLVTRYTKPDSVINHAITPELVGKSLLLTLDHDGRVVDIGLGGEGDMTLGWMLGMLGIDMLVGLTVSPILVAVGVCSLLNIAWTLSLPVMGRWSP